MSDIYYVYVLSTKLGFYIGVTRDIGRRLYEHRLGRGSGNYPFDSYTICGIFEDKTAALKFEDDLIRECECINKRRSGLISKDIREYYRSPDQVEKLNKYRSTLEYRKYKCAYDKKPEILSKQRGRKRNLHEGETMMFGKTHMLIYRSWFK